MEPRPKRPVFVTLLAAVVFFLSAAGFAGLIAGLVRWQIFVDLGLPLPLWVLVAASGVWGPIWLVVGWGLWQRLSWARRAAIICWIVYWVMMIGQQVVFVRGDYERGRLPFTIGTTLVLTALVIAGLMLPRVRQAFGDRNEQRAASNE